MKLVSVEQMRAIEQAANAAGHTYAAMMEQAGAAVAQAIVQRLSSVQHSHILVLVGPGNNGSDGLVAARILQQAGAQVACYLFKPRRSDDANLVAAKEQGCSLVVASDDDQGRELRRLAHDANVIVDALLGTGAARPIEGDLAKILEIVANQVEQRKRPGRRALTDLRLPSPPAGDAPLIVGVDGPTGMNYDTGELDPLTLPADISVTLACPKQGHFKFPAAVACGQLVVADIGVKPELTAHVALEVADPAMIRAMLPARPADAHKGTFGKVLIVAGSVYYSGAAALACQAAYRVGSGLVTLALPASIYPAVAARMLETTYLILPDDLGVVTPEAIKVLAEKSAAYQAMLVGPGLSPEKKAVSFVQRLFGAEPIVRKRIGFQAESSNTIEPLELPPLVVDADGLNALAQVDNWWHSLPPQTILTPHPGEMARLMRLPENDKQQLATQRWEIAQHTAAEWGHVIVLKGAHTVVAAPDGRTVVLPFATPALATAGSGDVLAGAIVGLLGQGLAPFEAALCGAYLHGLAGEMAQRDIGAAGVVAGDLLTRLPQAIQLV